MLPVDRKKLAQAWVKHTLAAAEKVDESPHFEAVEIISRMVEDDPEVAWGILEDIRQIDSSDIILANLAAGPLEDLLVFHGDDFIDCIEDIASHEPLFRKMLGAVWRNRISDEVWRRLQAVAGPSF